MAQTPKLYRIGAHPGDHDHTRAQTPPRRLLRARIWHDGRRWMASPDGRLAGTQRAARRDSGFCPWGSFVVARRLCLWPMGTAASGRCWRGRLHCRGFSAGCQLFHRVDDAASVLHRVPVGSGCRGETCGVHLSIAEFARIVSSRGAAGFPAASGVGHRAYDFSCGAQLPGHPLERQFSELDDGDRALTLRPPPGHQRRSWRSCQFSSRVSHDALRINPAHAPDRAVFHDRI